MCAVRSALSFLLLSPLCFIILLHGIVTGAAAQVTARCSSGTHRHGAGGTRNAPAAIWAAREDWRPLQRNVDIGSARPPLSSLTCSVSVALKWFERDLGNKSYLQM